MATTKKFEVHKMYKGTKTKTAKTMAEHNHLKKLGYGHSKPNKNKTMKKYQSGGWYRGGKISKSGKKALGVTGATAIGGMIGTAIDRGVKKNKAVKSIMKKDDVSRKKARQKYNKTNDAEVLGYFNDIKEKRLGGQYMEEGGSTEGCYETVMVAGKPKKRKRRGCGSKRNARKKRSYNRKWVG